MAYNIITSKVDIEMLHFCRIQYDTIPPIESTDGEHTGLIMDSCIDS